MDKEFVCLKMVINKKEHLKMVTLMEKENILRKMEKFMMENLKIINILVMEFSFFQMVQNMKVILLMMNLKEKENIHTAKEDIMMEIG